MSRTVVMPQAVVYEQYLKASPASEPVHSQHSAEVPPRNTARLLVLRPGRSGGRALLNRHLEKERWRFSPSPLLGLGHAVTIPGALGDEVNRLFAESLVHLGASTICRCWGRAQRTHRREEWMFK
jgi:hypothetical protein